MTSKHSKSNSPIHVENNFSTKSTQQSTQVFYDPIPNTACRCSSMSPVSDQPSIKEHVNFIMQIYKKGGRNWFDMST